MRFSGDRIGLGVERKAGGVRPAARDQNLPYMSVPNPGISSLGLGFESLICGAHPRENRPKESKVALRSYAGASNNWRPASRICLVLPPQTVRLLLNCETDPVNRTRAWYATTNSIAVPCHRISSSMHYRRCLYNPLACSEFAYRTPRASTNGLIWHDTA